MARSPVLQLTDIALTFGGDPLLNGVNLVVQPEDRLALVGRNGSGKSTLMKVMAGLVEPDSGAVAVPAGRSVAYMEQEPDFTGIDRLEDFALQGFDASQAYLIEAAAEGLGVDLAAPAATASGGERRRVALARLLAQAPDLMLLDEPTNHLDITAIAWLEARLAASRTAMVMISHDRAFLRALARGTLWLDRGRVRRQDKGFDAFEAWRDTVWDEEDLARHKLDRKIKAEARWAVEGISARRKRNQGRVRALQGLRADRADMIRRQGTAGLALSTGETSGKRVLEAHDLAKSFDGRAVVRPFSIRVERGDRIAFVGPNGVGKTTLVKLLTGQMAPDAGTVKLGTNVAMATIDQTRDSLDGNRTLWESLTTDPEMAVSGRSDQVMVRGTPRHVVGYLKEFLFDEAQARAPVRALSGGEKARLLLARVMARDVNLLVLDEPTNDLDIETLDLLQDVLADYPGTVLLISHDRDFLDRVATMTVAMEGDGRATVYPGGWSDYQRQRAPQAGASQPPVRPASGGAAPAGTQVPKPAAPACTTLSFTEKHRLAELPATIARLEAEIAKLSEFLSDAAVYTDTPAKAQKATQALAERQAALGAAEEEWLILEEKAEG